MPKQRYIELDALRSVAIFGMIVYHTAFDLSQFYGWDIDVFSGGWKIFQIAVASLFLLLVGVTSSFSTRHPFKRFLTIGSSALLVSVVTYLINPETYVRFGILHLIAVSGLLMPLLARFRMWLIIPGILLLLLGPSVSSIPPSSYFLLPLGIRPEHFATVDYFPLIPWFGVILIGCAIGPLCAHWMHQTAGRGPVSWAGKHSLLLYLIHQPIIIGILWIALGTPNF